MRQITYISTVRKDARGSDDVAPILAVSRRNNARDGITGLLLHDGKRFLQVLEGGEQALGAALARIRADPRHFAIVILKEREIAAREFSGWAMGEQRVAPAGEGPTLADTVDAMVANVPDPNLRAMFSAFGRRERAA